MSKRAVYTSLCAWQDRTRQQRMQRHKMRKMFSLMQNVVVGKCVVAWRDGAREQGALWRKAGKVVARLQHATEATALATWGVHARQAVAVRERAARAVMQTLDKISFRYFRNWARITKISLRIEYAYQHRSFQTVLDFFSRWASHHASCRALSSSVSMSEAVSDFSSAIRIATESVELAEFIASLSEAAVLFHGYQLRRAYSDAESARMRLLDSAQIFSGRPRLRALLTRILIEWATVCTVRQVRADAWAVCAATNARAELSEAGRARALKAWATSAHRFTLARLLSGWIAWACARRGRRLAGSAAKRRREWRILARVLVGFGRAALLAQAPSLLSV
jgi:hypothetical protein